MNTVNPEHERASEIKQARLFDATTALNTAMNMPGEITAAAGIELARTVALAMHISVHSAGTEEFFHNVVEEADAPNDTLAGVAAHFMMQSMTDRVDLSTLAGKQFLMAVAHTLGPDHLDDLRKHVAFMIRVEGFN